MARSNNARHKSHDGNGTRISAMRRANGSSRSRRDASINPEWLKDFLSEMLAVEMGGVKLYERALSDLEHSEHEEKLTEFLRQTERHVELCTDLLNAAGGDPGYKSPGAHAAEQKAEGLINTEVPPPMMDLNNIENLVLAETKDQWNWDLLDSISSKIGNAELKRIAVKAIREVRKQEQSHLSWNEKTLTELAMESAMRTTRAPAHERSEEAAESDREVDQG
jgi:hypothetical protein